jgi:hypothetical protein
MNVTRDLQLGFIKQSWPERNREGQSVEFVRNKYFAAEASPAWGLCRRGWA